jgi:hypothetical protein
MSYENKEGMETVKDAHYPQKRHFLSLFDDMARRVGKRRVFSLRSERRCFPERRIINKGELFPLTLVDTKSLQFYMGV